MPNHHKGSVISFGGFDMTFESRNYRFEVVFFGFTLIYARRKEYPTYARAKPNIPLQMLANFVSRFNSAIFEAFNPASRITELIRIDTPQTCMSRL